MKLFISFASFAGENEYFEYVILYCDSKMNRIVGYNKQKEVGNVLKSKQRQFKIINDSGKFRYHTFKIKTLYIKFFSIKLITLL